MRLGLVIVIIVICYESKVLNNVRVNFLGFNGIVL